MSPNKALRDYLRIKSNVEDLEIYVKEDQNARKVAIYGKHVKPGGPYNCQHSELTTQLSLETLQLIASAKGRHFRDEIERSENPDYMLRPLKTFINNFDIALNDKRILDFGCGGGAFSLNLLRLGATEVTGVEVDAKLLDIARSRLSDFFQTGFDLRVIEYIDSDHGLPLPSQAFDIVWLHAVLEHVYPSQRPYVLKELWRVLMPGGLLIVDATPNRLWLIENHTSQLLFMNYLPFSVAHFLARHLSERVPKKQTKEALLGRGFRGCTYWEIARALPNARWLNKAGEYRKKDLLTWMQNWKKDTDTRLKRTIKSVYGCLMDKTDSLLRILDLPQTAFLPWHYIVLQKGNEG